MKDQTRVINGDLLGLIAEYFKVLSEPLRIKILNSLKDGEKTVNEIVEAVDSSQPNVSRHLKILIKAGFIRRRQKKNMALCSIADERIWQICDIACTRKN